jgi:hypothetical protein
MHFDTMLKQKNRYNRKVNFEYALIIAGGRTLFDHPWAFYPRSLARFPESRTTV